MCISDYFFPCKYTLYYRLPQFWLPDVTRWSLGYKFHNGKKHSGCPRWLPPAFHYIVTFINLHFPRLIDVAYTIYCIRVSQVYRKVFYMRQNLISLLANKRNLTSIFQAPNTFSLIWCQVECCAMLIMNYGLNYSFKSVSWNKILVCATSWWGTISNSPERLSS